MSENKLYIVATAFGDADTGRVEATGIATWIAPSAEIATANVVSKYYAQGGLQLNLVGVSCMERTEADLLKVLGELRAANKPEEATKPTIVPMPERDHLMQMSLQESLARGYGTWNPGAQGPAPTPMEQSIRDVALNGTGGPPDGVKAVPGTPHTPDDSAA